MMMCKNHNVKVAQLFDDIDGENIKKRGKKRKSNKRNKREDMVAGAHEKLYLPVRSAINWLRTGNGHFLTLAFNNIDAVPSHSYVTHVHARSYVHLQTNDENFCFKYSNTYNLV